MAVSASTLPALVFPSAWIALAAGHQLADHWLQTNRQATEKGRPGWPGRRACAAHVAVITVTQLAVLAAVTAVTGVAPSGWQVAAGVTVNAASHYWADRRTTLVALADLLGKNRFVRMGDPAVAPVGTGRYALDQSWHGLWCLIAALIIAA